MDTIVLNAENRELDTWRQIYSKPCKVTLSDAARDAIGRCQEAVAADARKGVPIYGVTTGFGSLAGQAISEDKLTQLQHNLIFSTTVGVGEPLPDPVVRLCLALKVSTLARGYSGVRVEIAEIFLALLSNDMLPVVPSQGSVGASGDLAPLGHMSAILIGVGHVRHNGKVISAKEALGRIGYSPLELRAKEGLALVNGTQVSTALAMAALFEAERAMRSAIVIGALATEAVLGKSDSFDERIHAVRRQTGQIDVAKAYRALLQDSGFRHASQEIERQQDPYCIRCQPQIIGAALDLLRHCTGVLTREGDAVTDNPLYFPEEGEFLSGGNFHAEPIAFSADIMALAISEIATISERRLSMMVDSNLSGLPPFLTSEPGLNSGFMCAQISAAALVADTRQRAHPASVDNVPTVANMEDHVSMATHGARRLLGMIENLDAILAIELLAAVEGCDHRGLEHGQRLGSLHAMVRKDVSSLALDQWLEPPIAASLSLVRNGSVAHLLEEADLAVLS
ncbi:MAG: histidine ammonia-lyase [Alphaproteobacteria bacterium]